MSHILFCGRYLIIISKAKADFVVGFCLILPVEQRNLKLGNFPASRVYSIGKIVLNSVLVKANAQSQSAMQL